jgi:general secretion pathway protein A
MFLDFYKLREQPFSDTPDPRYVYLSLTHREAIASLAYGIEAGRGFLVLVAEPGMGKTTLLFHLLEWLRKSARTAFLFQTQCGSRALLRYLLADLGIDAQGKELAWMHEQLKEVLISEAGVGRRLVIFIDEAQNLRESVLETVRLLSNFENSRSKLIQIILAGQPQLADTLARPAMAQLRQRVSILSRLSPFTLSETEAYINHRLSVAGSEGRQLFTPEARARIADWSRGVPRNINNLCFNALSLGYALGRKEIGCSLVQEAANDLEVNPSVSQGYGAAHIENSTSISESMKERINALDQSGVHLPEIALKSPAEGKTPVATAEEPARPQPVVSTPASAPGSRSASTPSSILPASATRPKAPAVVPPPANDFRGSLPMELIALAAEAAQQSTVSPMTATVSPGHPTPVRSKAGFIVQKLRENPSPSFVSDLLGSPLKRVSHTIMLAGAVVVPFVVGAAGAFFLHRGTAQHPVTNPVQVASPVSTAADTVQRVRSASSRAAVASRKPQARKPAWPGRIPNGEFLASLAAAPRSAATIGRDASPDLTGVASDAPADAIQGTLPWSSHILPALAPTSEPTAPVLVSGRVKEPQLVSKILPNYPPAAKQIALEGNVVIDAVIDTTGNVTKMKVVSGPVLLQRAALDSVSKWKYEPSYLDDTPVPVEMFISVEFRLQ